MPKAFAYPWRRAVPFVALLVLLPAARIRAADPEVRGFYAAAFDVNTQAKLDALLADVDAYNFNAIFLQVRSRGDAFYFPNRDDDTYPNPEPRGQTYSISPSDLDVLQYVIDRAHEKGVEVHAWVTVLPIWNRSSLPASPDHAYRTHPEWVTEDASGNTMSPSTDSEGAYLDPGIPAVQDYLFDVFMDIVRNYDIDGIHLDYVRYKGTEWGYDPVTRSRFLDDTGLDVIARPDYAAGAWNLYRRQQLTTIVQRLTDRVRLEKPNVVVSAFLIGFTDSVPNKLQGYNWWSAHDAIDVLCGSYYGTSLSTAHSRYDRYQNYNYGGKPMVMAFGAEAVAFGNTPSQMRSFVLDFRANARPPLGFVHFDISGLQADGDALFHGLSDPGYPYDTTVTIPADLRPGADTVAPNPPASVAAASAGGTVTVTFQRPAPAADGDLPIQYRIYRSASSTVPLRYDNLAMVYWDLEGTRSTFQWTDGEPFDGLNHYRVAAYDDYHNTEVSAVVSASASPVDYIIESRTGGLHHDGYSEAGTWYDSSSHSTAPGLTPGIGSRWALPADANGRADRARFRPDLPAAGRYEIFLTTYRYASANAKNAQVRIVHADGTTVFNRDITSTEFGDRWISLGTYRFDAGTAGYLEINNTTQSNLGTSTDARLNADAARFVGVAEPVPWERRPDSAAPETLPVTLVADNAPYRLDYEDGTGWADASSYLSSYYGNNARYASSHPTPSVACWVVDIPAAGWYRIEGHVRGNNVFTTTAVYRFRDASGLQTVTATQRNGGAAGSGYWSIRIDGGSPRYFEAGPVYVTLSDESASGGLVIADAIRFVPWIPSWDRIEMY